MKKHSAIKLNQSDISKIIGNQDQEILIPTLKE